MTYCNLPPKAVGPYNQTLFLGCSVTNFNCNLGWGAEQSTLTVSLVEDNCFHPDHPRYVVSDTKIETIIQQPDGTINLAQARQGKAFHKKQAGSSDVQYEYEDPTKGLHKNIAKELKDLEDIRDEENKKLPTDIKDDGKILYDINGNRKRWTDPDPGFIGLSGLFSPSGYDILGIPVRFKFNNFSFGGMVSSWKQNGSQGGNRLYEVEIKSFASLLNGSQLIIGGYAGGVCGIVEGAIPQGGNKPLAVPISYTVDTSVPTPQFSFKNHRASIEQGNIPNVINIYGYIEYKGLQQKIYGNSRINENGMKAEFIYDAINLLLGLPSLNNSDSSSVFSPYGGLLCRSISVNGTSVIVDPMTENVSGSSGVTMNLVEAGVCPVGIDPLISNLKKTRLLLDISEVPRPPRWYRIQGPVISIMQFITEMCDGFGFDFFVDFLPANSNLRGKGYSGIIKIRTVSRRIHPRKNNVAELISLLTKTIDIEDTSRIATIQSQVNSLNAQKNSLITQEESLLNQLNNVYTDNGKLGYLSEPWKNAGNQAYQQVLDQQGTEEQAIAALQAQYQQAASVRNQITQINTNLQNNRLQQANIAVQINKLITEGNGVNSYTYGKEFTDSNTRSMYIGGKQKRLLQLKNVRLAYKQNTLIYNPFAANGAGALINYDAIFGYDTIPNQVRFPNLLSTRRYPFKIVGGAAVAEDTVQFDAPEHFSKASQSLQIQKGNYLKAADVRNPTEPFLGTVGNIGANVALMNDVICPYFGEGSNGLIRPVYFDKQMGQMQIVFNIADIENLTSLPLARFNPYIAAGDSTQQTVSSPIFLVLENEIRAAGGGFKSWIDYCFNNVFTTDIAEVIYKGFLDKYGFGSTPGASPLMFNVAKNEFIAGMSSISIIAGIKPAINAGNNNGNPRQVNLDMLAPYFKTLYNDLSNIHQFFKNIADEYYAKQYMVRIPELAWYRDFDYAVDNNNRLISIGTDKLNRPVYAIEGTGKIYSNYQLSPDGAWEEPGNYIDDTMVVGGARATFFADDTGKIPPILGFNATVEKDYSRRWKRLKFLDSISRINNMDVFTTANWIADMERMFNDDGLNEMNHYYININHNLSSDEHMSIPYMANSLPIPMAHGEIAPTNGFFSNDKTLGRHKLYVKASIGEDIQFLQANARSPRSILRIPSPVFVGANKNSTDNNTYSIMLQDGLLKLAKGSSVPQFLQNAAGGGTLPGARSVYGGLGPNWWFIPSELASTKRGFEFTFVNSCTVSNFDGTEGSSAPNLQDSLGKAAIPMFCALPLEFNTVIYGPWINHPGLIKDIIFPDADTDATRINEVENLIGGVKVQVDESLVPWNYGGHTALDEAVMNKIADDVNYQQTLETGTIQVPTFDNFNLGDMLKFYAGLFNGPVINSIQVQIGQGGINSTYNFRTYIRKLGLFNKENAERIKTINQEAIKRNKELTNKLIQLISKLGAGSFIRLF